VRLKKRHSLLLLPALGAAIAAATVAAPALRAAPKKDTRPNIVVIMSDDERLDGTSVMRNVQRLLVDRGVTFTDYHVTTSSCGPSRATILSGDYSHHTGVIANFGPTGGPAFNSSSTLATWLHDAGYETGLVGKYLNGYASWGQEVTPPGWDDWVAMDSTPVEKYYNYALDENGTIVRYGYASSDYSTHVLTGKAVDFIHEARRPFFLYFAPVAPHLPAIPAKRDRNKLQNLAPLNSPAFNQRNVGKEPWAVWHKNLMSAAARLYVKHVRRRQEQSLLSLDRGVKQIVDALAQRHELRNTVILYTSDNGFLWGEHRLGGKLWPYEESTHVPLVVRTPWTTHATKSAKPVLNVDLAPTIAALAGVQPPVPEDGRSFLPLLQGTKIPWRGSFLVEYLGPDKLASGGPYPYIGVQSKKYLYVEYFNGWRELYNLRRDPWELDNVAEDPAYRHTDDVLHALVHKLYAAPPVSPPQG
jgi:arylsulfatase A-like enzyme